jgi:hypothetical protein
MISWTELGRRWDGNVAARRRLLPAVWSTTFHRLFSEDTDEMGGQDLLLHESVRPERPGRAVDMAVRAYDDKLVGPTALRLVGNNVLHSRYRLDQTGRAAMRSLAHRVEGGSSEEQAVRRFAQCRDLYSKPRERMRSSSGEAVADRAEPHADASAMPDAATPLDPSNYLTYLDVSFDGKMSTCAFELALPVHKNQIVSRVDPRTWTEADSVHFLETRVLEHSEGDAKPLGPPGTTSWRGKYLERFVLPWNTQMLSYFSVELFADVSIEESGARMDYSLLREEKRQIVRDFGFVSVRTRPRYPGWSIVSAEKNTAYSSPLLNALNPAVLGTWIQDQVRTFWGPLEPSPSSAQKSSRRSEVEEDEA